MSESPPRLRGRAAQHSPKNRFERLELSLGPAEVDASPKTVFYCFAREVRAARVPAAKTTHPKAHERAKKC